MGKSNSIILLDIDNTLFNTEELKRTNLTTFELFGEVEEALRELAKIATLGIFSQGEIAFQNNKLSQTNIKQYFLEEHTHIVEYKASVMKEVLHTYAKIGEVYFIDDWLDWLRIAKQSVPSVFTIWMKRGEYAHTQEIHSDFTPDAVVPSLKEVLPLIKDSITK